MEEAVALINKASEEMEKAREELRKLANDATKLGDIILPKMAEHVNELRSARMSVVREIHESLTAMREVRRFFLDRDYDVEITRLERFVALCGQLRSMKEDGTLDAVALVAIRLAVQEEQ